MTFIAVGTSTTTLGHAESPDGEVRLQIPSPKSILKPLRVLDARLTQKSIGCIDLWVLESIRAHTAFGFQDEKIEKCEMDSYK